MERLNMFGTVTAGMVAEAARRYGTPLYLYDEAQIKARCGQLLAMPNAYGLTVRYAMKANSGRALLRVISGQGLKIDASSVNEARRAQMAGIGCDQIMLTTQEVPAGEARQILEGMMLQGMRYNVCSLRQLQLVADFAAEKGLPLSVRVHPGVGAGETATRNTGDNYSCFGIHRSDLAQVVDYAAQKGIVLDEVHVHIGSGGDPAAWRENIDRELEILAQYFPAAHTISFGGGLKEARMPDETAADIQALGAYAKQQLEAFCAKTGRQLHMEVEPGTYVVANTGYIVTEVLDKKRTGDEGLHFVIVDGGMELNARPLLYGSRHPFYVVSAGGELLSSEFTLDKGKNLYQAVVVGRCCESGDAQSLDADGRSLPREMAQPAVGDFVVIGGAGAYCSSMAPFNYNSHVQAPEVLLTEAGELVEIRRRQTLEQLTANEL